MSDPNRNLPALGPIRAATDLEAFEVRAFIRQHPEYEGQPIDMVMDMLATRKDQDEDALEARIAFGVTPNRGWSDDL